MLHKHVQCHVTWCACVRWVCDAHSGACGACERMHDATLECVMHVVRCVVHMEVFMLHAGRHLMHVSVP